LLHSYVLAALAKPNHVAIVTEHCQLDFLAG